MTRAAGGLNEVLWQGTGKVFTVGVGNTVESGREGSRLCAEEADDLRAVFLARALPRHGQ